MTADAAPGGWLVIDKPKGLTSNRVVEIVRRHTGTKAGHAGTLDPMATGVLPVALGEATKTVAYAMSGWKLYRFLVRWGIARDSGDSDGALIAETAARPSRAAIEAALPRFTGTILQSPPAYSAVKIGGRRAYALARAAQAPQIAPRPVEIAEFTLEEVSDQDHARFAALVGKGTYIRALACDLAAALGTLGHVAELRRLSVGPFRESQAISLEFLAECRHNIWGSGHLLPIETALDDIPALALTGTEALRLRRGQRVTPLDPAERARLQRIDEGTIVSARCGRAVIALAKIESGGLRPLRVINC